MKMPIVITPVTRPTNAAVPSGPSPPTVGKIALSRGSPIIMNPSQRTVATAAMTTRRFRCRTMPADASRRLQPAVASRARSGTWWNSARVGASVEHPELRGRNQADRHFVTVHRLPVDPPKGHRADVLGDVDDLEDVTRPHAVLLEERQQARVLFRLLGHAQDGDRAAARRIGHPIAGGAVGRVAVARDRVAVRTGRRAAEQLVDAVGDPVAQRVLEVMCLLIGLRPAKPDHLGQQPLGQRVASECALGGLAATIGEGQLAGLAINRDELLPHEASDHLGDGRRAHAEALGQARRDHRLPLAVHVADRHQVLGRGLARFPGAQCVRHSSILERARVRSSSEFAGAGPMRTRGRPRPPRTARSAAVIPRVCRAGLVDVWAGCPIRSSRCLAAEATCLGRSQPSAGPARDGAQCRCARRRRPATAVNTTPAASSAALAASSVKSAPAVGCRRSTAVSGS